MVFLALRIDNFPVVTARIVFPRNWQAFGGLSADFWQAFGGLLADFWQAFGGLLAGFWWAFDGLSAEFWQAPL